MVKSTHFCRAICAIRVWKGPASPVTLKNRLRTRKLSWMFLSLFVQLKLTAYQVEKFQTLYQLNQKRGRLSLAQTKTTLIFQFFGIKKACSTRMILFSENPLPKHTHTHTHSQTLKRNDDNKRKVMMTFILNPISCFINQIQWLYIPGVALVINRTLFVIAPPSIFHLYQFIRTLAQIFLYTTSTKWLSKIERERESIWRVLVGVVVRILVLIYQSCSLICYTILYCGIIAVVPIMQRWYWFSLRYLFLSQIGNSADDALGVYSI